MRWLPLKSLKDGRVGDLNKFVLSTWDLKQDLHLRYNKINHKVALTSSCIDFLSQDEVAMVLLHWRKL